MLDPLNDHRAGGVAPNMAGRKITRIGLVLGIVSVIPYLGTLLWGPTYGVWREIMGGQGRPIAIGILNFFLFLGLYAGMPVGLAAVVTSTIGLGKRYRTARTSLRAMASILLGLGGIAGGLWFFTRLTCC